VEPSPWVEVGILGAFAVGSILGVIATIRITRIVAEWLKNQPPEKEERNDTGSNLDES